MLRGLHRGSLALYRRSRSYQRLRSLPVVTALTERVHSLPRQRRLSRRVQRSAVPASAEMREYFGFDRHGPSRRCARVVRGLWRRQPFAPEAVAYFRTLRLEVGTLDEPMGGGYWFGDRKLVMVRGTQDEAAVHELAHAWWEQQRETPPRRR